MTTDTCWYKSVCTNNCNSYCIRYNLMRTLFEQSRLPEALWDIRPLTCGTTDFKAFTRLSDIGNDMLSFIDNGNNLYIYSTNCGNGKTSWAVKLLCNYFKEIWHLSCLNCKALFISVPQFLYNCKRSISQDVPDFHELCTQIEQANLVIWDDIACGVATSYELQILQQYIDNRINSGRSNIYTSNQNREGLTSTVGERLASRIWGCSEVIELKEKDKRGLNNG